MHMTYAAEYSMRWLRKFGTAENTSIFLAELSLFAPLYQGKVGPKRHSSLGDPPKSRQSPVLVIYNFDINVCLFINIIVTYVIIPTPQYEYETALLRKLLLA